MAGAGGADRAGADVAGSEANDRILSANNRLVKRRHLTSLQAESSGLLGIPSSIPRIRSQAAVPATSRISFQCFPEIFQPGLVFMG